MLCFEGAIKPYCLSLFSAITVMGTDILSLSLRMSCPKTPRICSNRKATSRPRFSPASVITEKCGERTSIHLVSSLANANGEKQLAITKLTIAVPIKNLRIPEESFPENASTVAERRASLRPGMGKLLPVHLSPWPRPRTQVKLSFVTSAPSSRLAWIDWMRGLACVLMFQTHCYDAWLGGDARNTGFLKASVRLGTLPAPL